MTIEAYLQAIRDALGKTQVAEIQTIISILYDAFIDGRSVFVFGNGASAALASHMATDMGKLTALDLGEGPRPRSRKRLRITSLNDNVPWLTALGNDVSFADVFLEQLKNFLEPKDVVIGISGSGGSPNVLRALEFARSVGAVCISLTGDQRKWVDIAGFSDVCLRAPLAMMEQIEDLHVIYHHLITRGLFDRIVAAPE